jgi:hypothetical protein
VRGSSGDLRVAVAALRSAQALSSLYRLLDQTNYRKSVDQLLRLLKVLDCDVQLVVRAKSA